ncbi:MAG: GNAT family N-acetyltransferase [Arenimonas sp.]
MVIRNVQPIDAEPLAELALKLGQPLDASRFSQDIAAYAPGFYVAESSDEIIGYLVMRFERSPCCVQGMSPVQLWRLFVAPEHQGKGVAAGLMSQAFAYARARAHDVVWLGTSEDNARAIAFYRKGGFNPIGVAELHQGHEAHQDLIMSASCNDS